METPDRTVRGQIDAVMAYLVSRGFHNVHEHSEAPLTPGVHTILATCDRARCILRLHYDWLAQHDGASASSWIDAKAIADSMLSDPDADEVIIASGGQGQPGLIHFPRMRV